MRFQGSLPTVESYPSKRGDPDRKDRQTHLTPVVPETLTLTAAVVVDQIHQQISHHCQARTYSWGLER